MSIINDALKRAQQNLEKKGKKTAQEATEKANQLTKGDKPRTAPPPPKPGPEKSKKPSHKKKKVWYQTVSVLVAIFLVVIGILVATLFFLMKRSSSTKDSGSEIRKNYQPKPFQKRAFKEGELILSGTSLIESKRVAIINDDIYEQGDIIQGYKITKIDLKKVELKSPDGDVITLRVAAASN